MSSISQEIQALLKAPDTSLSQARLRKHLDETFAQFDDLDSLDSVCQRASEDNHRLRQQLEASSSVVSQQIATASSSANVSLTSAKELSLTRHALADQLLALSEELLPPTTAKGKQARTLLEEMESLHEQLKELQHTKTYMAILERALALREDAIAQIRSSSQGPISHSSLTKYQDLQAFVSSVGQATKPMGTSQAQLKLVEFTQAVRDQAWKDIKAALSDNLLAAAERLHWPTPMFLAEYLMKESADRNSFEAAFLGLLQLQAAGEKLNLDETALSATSPENVKSYMRKQGLYPLQTLLEPISLRFRYHFEGKRQTNRPDKPEWYFTHVLNLMHEHRSFVAEVAQPLLQRGGYGDVNAVDEFTRLLCNLPARKLKKTITMVLNLPGLLAHTIYQTLVFDGSVKDGGFQLSRSWEGKERIRLSREKRDKAREQRQLEKQRAGDKRSRKNDSQKIEDPFLEWEGLTEVILGRKEWFDAWLYGEKRFTDNQYNDIISSPDAWQIADDSGDADDGDSRRAVDLGTRTTTSARRFKVLVERVTERYSPLPHLTHRAQFLFEIQLPLIDAYLARVTSSLDAYERLSSSFVRAVPGALVNQVGHGVDTRRMTSGVEGLARLVKALVSARWVKAAMESWGEDLFFLEMWQDIQENPILRARADTNSLLPPSHSVKNETDNALFDELIKRYGDLTNRAEDMAVNQIFTELEGELKGYFSSQWDKTGAQDLSSETGVLSLPAALVAPISLLSSYLTFLTQSVPDATTTALYRRIATTISGYILQRSISLRGRHQFSPTEGLAFKDECAMWVEASRIALTGSSSRGDSRIAKRIEHPWQELTDVAALVGMPEEQLGHVADLAWGGVEAGFQEAMSDLGVKGLNRENAKSVLRARSDCRR